MERKPGISLIEQHMIDMVREFRIEKKLNQVQFSVMLGLNESFVGNVESYTHPLKYNVKHINKISIVFEVSIYRFIPEFGMQWPDENLDMPDDEAPRKRPAAAKKKKAPLKKKVVKVKSAGAGKNKNR